MRNSRRKKQVWKCTIIANITLKKLLKIQIITFFKDQTIVVLYTSYIIVDGETVLFKLHSHIIIFV